MDEEKQDEFCEDCLRDANPAYGEAVVAFLDRIKFPEKWKWAVVEIIKLVDPNYTHG